MSRDVKVNKMEIISMQGSGKAKWVIQKKNEKKNRDSEMISEK